MRRNDRFNGMVLNWLPYTNATRSVVGGTIGLRHVSVLMIQAISDKKILY